MYKFETEKVQRGVELRVKRWVTNMTFTQEMSLLSVLNRS